MDVNMSKKRYIRHYRKIDLYSLPQDSFDIIISQATDLGAPKEKGHWTKIWFKKNYRAILREEGTDWIVYFKNRSTYTEF